MWLQMPTGVVAKVRENCVNASERFTGIFFVNLKFVFSVFHGDGEQARAGHGFKRSGRCWMEHANAKYKIVRNVGEDDRGNDCGKRTGCNLRSSHAASIAK